MLNDNDIKDIIDDISITIFMNNIKNVNIVEDDIVNIIEEKFDVIDSSYERLGTNYIQLDLKLSISDNTSEYLSDVDMLVYTKTDTGLCNIVDIEHDISFLDPLQRKNTEMSGIPTRFSSLDSYIELVEKSEIDYSEYDCNNCSKDCTNCLKYINQYKYY